MNSGIYEQRRVRVGTIVADASKNLRDIDNGFKDQYVEDMLNYAEMDFKARKKSAVAAGDPEDSVERDESAWQSHWGQRIGVIETDAGLELFRGFHTRAAAIDAFGDDHLVDVDVVIPEVYSELTGLPLEHITTDVLIGGENGTHGRRRTKTQRNKAIDKWLLCEVSDDSSHFSDGYIAKACNVSAGLVLNRRRELQSSAFKKPAALVAPEERIYVKHGKIQRPANFVSSAQRVREERKAEKERHQQKLEEKRLADEAKAANQASEANAKAAAYEAQLASDEAELKAREAAEAARIAEAEAARQAQETAESQASERDEDPPETPEKPPESPVLGGEEQGGGETPADEPAGTSGDEDDEREPDDDDTEPEPEPDEGEGEDADTEPDDDDDEGEEEDADPEPTPGQTLEDAGFPPEGDSAPAQTEADVETTVTETFVMSQDVLDAHIPPELQSLLAKHLDMQFKGMIDETCSAETIEQFKQDILRNGNPKKLANAFVGMFSDAIHFGLQQAREAAERAAAEAAVNAQREDEVLATVQDAA